MAENPNFISEDQAQQMESAGLWASVEQPPVSPTAKVPPPQTNINNYGGVPLPQNLGLQPDLTQTIYPPSTAPIRLMPIVQTAANNAASKSVAIEVVNKAIAAIPTVVVPPSTTDGLIHGTTPWETDPSSLIISEDFVGVQSATFQPTSLQGPIGIYGWIFAVAPASSVANPKTSGWGALFGSIGGSIAWDNNGSQGEAGTLLMDAMNTASASPVMPGAMALLENPGWKATFVWKFDGALNGDPPNFSATKKAFYIGLSGNWIPVTALNTNGLSYPARPMVFIGLRFDTSTGPGELPLSSVGTSSGGLALYSFLSTTEIASNGALVGQKFTVAGYTGANNNGTFTCAGSTSSGLVLENSAATAETHAATATSSASLADSVYTCEAVMNPAYTTTTPRNNEQGQTSGTSVAIAAGVAHRLDITCSAVGVVSLALDGTTVGTFTIHQLQIVLQYTGSGLGSTAGVASNQAHVSMVAQGGSALSTSANNPAATICPFTGGSKITIAGMTSTLAPLNGSWVLGELASAGTDMFFDAPGVSNITNANVAAGATVTGYPALLPFAAFGNDDSASPTASTMRFYWDYFGLAVNPGVNGGTGTPSSSKARYF